MNINIKKNLKNSLIFKYLNFTLILISGFALIPFYLKNFSLELYGIWILISAITTGLMLIDPGSVNLLIQQIAKKIGKKNNSNLSEIILSALLNTIIITSIIFLIGMIFGNLLVIWIVDSTFITNEIKTTFKYAIYALTITLLGQTLYGTLEGFQKTFFSGLIVFLSTSIKIISVILLINLNFGIKSLPLSDLISSLFSFIVFTLYILINFKFFFKKLNLRFNEYKRYTYLFLYGYMGRLSKIFTSGNIDHLIIGKMIGLENVSMYYFAQTLPKKLESLIGVLFLSARPSLAYISGNSSKKKFSKLKLRLIYLISLLVIFSVYILNDIINPFLKLWLNKDVHLSFYIVLLIVILTAQRMLTNFFSIILFSDGKIKQISKLQVIYSIVLIPFLIVSVKFYGLLGLLIAHIAILFLSLTLFLSIMLLKDMFHIKLYIQFLLKEIIFLILTAISSLIIYNIILQFINIQTISWQIFIVLLLIKFFLFLFILFIMSKNFRNEFLYFLKKKEFISLNKWKV